jgi:hypothetical protein
VFTRENEASVHTDPVIYGYVIERLFELSSQPAGGDLTKMPLLNVLVVGAILLVPGLAGGRLSRQSERWVPFVVGLLTFMLMPRFAFSTAYVFHRVAIFLVPLWLLAWDPPEASRERRVDWAVMLVVVIWGLTNVSHFAGFAAETRSFDRVMVHMESGRRVGALYVHPWSPNFSRPVYLNFAAWYQAERAGIVDYNFANSLAQMVRYKDRDRFAPRINEFLAWNPQYFRWDRHGGDSYDYFLIKAPADPAAVIFKEKQQSVELMAREGWWWLYRNNERRPSGAPTRQISEAERQRWAEEERLGR